MPKEVVAKRGCTCCGTGCVILGALVPAASFVLWETLGLVASIGVWLVALASAHAVRFARGTHPVQR